MSLKEKAIIALDFENGLDTKKFLKQMDGELSWIKIGLELFISEGPNLVIDLAKDGYQIFLDLKLHDISKTVEKSLLNIAKLPVKMTTLHYSCGPKFFKSIEHLALPFHVLGVTALTSLDEEDIAFIYGKEKTAKNLVKSFINETINLSHPSGCVCSGNEAKIVRELLTLVSRKYSFCIVCPGVRFDAINNHDQARVTHPFDALKNGADHVVVGRELTLAANPKLTWQNWKELYEKTFN